MSVIRLDHVNICSGRFEQSLDFYVEGLGLTRGSLPAALAADPDSASRGAWLCDASGLAIVHLLRAEGETEQGVSAVDHFALACDDYEAAAGRLRRAGVAYQADDYPQIGVRQLVVRDPNGVKIELNFPLAG